MGAPAANKTALYIRTAFLFRPNVVVIAVPFLVGAARRIRDRIDYDEMLDERVPDELRDVAHVAEANASLVASRGRA